MPPAHLPLLYGELASWFHLLTPPEDYAVEAAWYLAALTGATEPCATLLELGSGGGNNASHLTARLRCTLTDLSPAMLEQSRRLADPNGRPEAKLSASERGGALGLVGASDATRALLAAEGAGASLKLANADGRGQLVRP